MIGYVQKYQYLINIIPQRMNVLLFCCRPVGALYSGMHSSFFSNRTLREHSRCNSRSVHSLTLQQAIYIESYWSALLCMACAEIQNNREMSPYNSFLKITGKHAATSSDKAEVLLQIEAGCYKLNLRHRFLIIT